MRRAAISLGMVGLLLWAVMLPAAGPAQQQTSITTRDGSALYSRYCASCHGLDGKGAGPVAEDLRQQPPDLTRIRARYDGRFPYSRLRDAIDGRRQVAGHGPREMPVWGHRLAEDFPDPKSRELRISGEITALLAHLESIQEPVPEEGEH